jgi:hypothetical protein
MTGLTKTDSGPIVQASLIVRYVDFHPLGERIVLASGKELEVEELSFKVLEEKIPPTQPTHAVQKAAVPANKRIDTPQPPASLDFDALELQIRYLLFSRELDLDEDLNLIRRPDRIIITGTASSEARAAEVRTLLGKLSGVQVSIVAPGRSEPLRSATRAATRAASQAPSSRALLSDIMDATLRRGRTDLNSLIVVWRLLIPQFPMRGHCADSPIDIRRPRNTVLATHLG